MAEMTYSGKNRTVIRGPRRYDLKRGTFDVHPDDVATLEEVGAKVKDDGGTSADSTESEEG